MLRYDFESSRRLLYSGAIKTWFKAIFENRKMPFLVLQVVVIFKNCRRRPEQPHEAYVFFQKLPPEGRTTTWSLCFFQKLPPEGRIHHEAYLLFSKDSTKMSKSKLFTLLTPWNSHIFQKFSPKGRIHHEFYIFFQKFSPKGKIHHETYVLFSEKLKKPY